MRLLYRMTLQSNARNGSTGQSASIRVSLTSSRLKGAPYWPSIYQLLDEVEQNIVIYLRRTLARVSFEPTRSSSLIYLVLNAGERH
jgi:predicted NAD/FAD-dependent oxidoreductase